MKKILLALALILSFTGCGNTAEENKSKEVEAKVTEENMEKDSIGLALDDENEEDYTEESQDLLEEPLEEETSPELDENSSLSDEEKESEDKPEELRAEDTSNNQESDFAKLLGHRPEDGSFQLAFGQGMKFAYFNLKSDGSFTASYGDRGTNPENMEMEWTLCDFQGRFELGDAIDDHVYQLNLVDLEMTSKPGEEKTMEDGYKGTYVEEIPLLSTDNSYKLVLRGADPSVLGESSQLLQYVQTGTETDNEYKHIKSNLIMGEAGQPLFVEVINEEAWEDFSLWEKLHGLNLDSNVAPSQSLVSSIEFLADGNFKGSYYMRGKFDDEYDTADSAQQYATDEIRQAEFIGKFDLIGQEDGIYKLKVTELEVTSEPGINPEAPYAANVDYIEEFAIGDELDLISPGTYISKEARAGTVLEYTLHPPLYLNDYLKEGHDPIIEDQARGWVLYNKTQDAGLTDWSE